MLMLRANWPTSFSQRNWLKDWKVWHLLDVLIFISFFFFWFALNAVLFIVAANLSEIHVYSLHPGVISSDLGRHLDSTMFSGATFVWNVLAKPFIKSVEQGAQTTIYCAVDEKAGEETGLYYRYRIIIILLLFIFIFNLYFYRSYCIIVHRECGRTEPSSKAKDAKLAERFWEESIKLIGWSPSLTIEQIIDKVTKGELE